jgi:hypothetical protein
MFASLRNAVSDKGYHTRIGHARQPTLQVRLIRTNTPHQLGALFSSVGLMHSAQLGLLQAPLLTFSYVATAIFFLGRDKFGGPQTVTNMEEPDSQSDETLPTTPRADAD